MSLGLSVKISLRANIKIEGGSTVSVTNTEEEVANKVANILNLCESDPDGGLELIEYSKEEKWSN